VGCSVVATPGLSGCIGSSGSGSEGLSSEGQQLLEMYEDGYDHHLDGYDNFEQGIDAYHSEDFEQAESLFVDAESGYENARDIVVEPDVDIIELFNMNEGDGYPDEYSEAIEAISNAMATLGILTRRVAMQQDTAETQADLEESLPGMEGSLDDIGDMEELISDVETELSDGEYSMPSPDQFEQILE